MPARFAGLLVKEMIQFLRDRVMLVLILWLYTAEVVICALALSLDVSNLPLGVVDRDATQASRALVDRFRRTDSFAVNAHASNLPVATRWLQNGRVRMVLVIPEGFQRSLARRSRPTLQLLVDGTNSNTAAQARAYALQIVYEFERQRLGDAATDPPPVGAVVRVWYNSSLSYTTFVVLSMIALAAFMVGVIHPAASIVREKEVGTIEQLQVPPLSVGELFAAKTIPTLMIGVLSIFPSLLIAWWFDVPLRGSVALFVALTALFLVSAIGIGVLIAAITRTLQQALLLSFFGLFPLMFLSGTISPIESMPESLQTLSYLSPLRHFMDVILGIFLKGSTLAQLWPQTLALVAIGAVLFGASFVIFRRSWS